MNKESAKTFLIKLIENQEFAAKLKECKTFEEFCRCIATAGLDFTEEECIAIRSELSDEDLQQISGGTQGPQGGLGPFRPQGVDDPPRP